MLLKTFNEVIKEMKHCSSFHTKIHYCRVVFGFARIFAKHFQVLAGMGAGRIQAAWVVPQKTYKKQGKFEILTDFWEFELNLE